MRAEYGVHLWWTNLIRLNFAILASCSLIIRWRAVLYCSNCCGDIFFISIITATLFSSITPNIRLLSDVNHSNLLLYRQIAWVSRASICRNWSFEHDICKKVKNIIVCENTMIQFTHILTNISYINLYSDYVSNVCYTHTSSLMLNRD